MRRLHRAHVIVRRNQSDDRKLDRDRENKPLPSIIVSDAKRCVLLRWMKAPRLLNGAVVPARSWRSDALSLIVAVIHDKLLK
jgi:hypothetical protein